MADVIPLPIGNDSDTLSEFKMQLLKEHKKDLIIVADRALRMLRLFGFQINSEWKRESLKKLTSELYELRAKNIRFMLYFDGKDFFIILHGFLKETQKTPQHHIEQAEREIKRWKEIRKDWSL